MGIIGRNGAGKSTLLKILSRITEPTTGRAVINGRVGSLLEVGTGFHPELTARENVYLNGAILGMLRDEIDRKFDEIVAFSELERFLDTPVKRFSSGMYVRLAFAVAAHLEPEILFIDEVLAVGDTDFQKRSLGKMNDIKSEGRTVLFVSHNMNIIQRLCQQTILLDQGEILAIGKTNDVIKTYINHGLEDNVPEKWIDVWETRRLPKGKSSSYFLELWYSSHNQEFNCHPYPDGPLEIKFRIFSDKSKTIDSMAISLYDRFGYQLVNADTITLGEQIDLLSGITEISLRSNNCVKTRRLYCRSLVGQPAIPGVRSYRPGLECRSN